LADRAPAFVGIGCRPRSGLRRPRELLARDLLQRGVLSAPFSNALPGARYYLVTTEAVAQRADIIALREWLLSQMASGDGGHPTAG
ncbi:hypothetical protein K4G99_22320, partial [Mycobacterium tuberculosis]|nr:hypothetical protein [Mycobacterium tuberculosis]